MAIENGEELQGEKEQGKKKINLEVLTTGKSRRVLIGGGGVLPTNAEERQ